jgi:hypothetical protein
MTIIHRLSEAIGEVRDWLCLVGHECLTAHQARQTEERAKAIHAVLVACALIGPSLALPAWSTELSSLGPEIPKTVVVAGVGYENAETSTITVKIYDAENGAILSEETYELNVKEDLASAGSQPRERIFAGGVGPGTDGLSAFPLRAYDAVTGRFLWEGLLNLNVGGHETGGTQRVVAHLPAPRATVTQVHSRGVVDIQPQFLLRAIDSVTGHLLWVDQFSSWTGRLARPERVSRAVIGQTEEGGATPSQQIEFRIRMTDNLDRQILWEDTIEPIGDETELASEHADAAEILPAWHGAEFDEINKEEI